jgi:hypothetical protein
VAQAPPALTLPTQSGSNVTKPGPKRQDNVIKKSVKQFIVPESIDESGEGDDLGSDDEDEDDGPPDLTPSSELDWALDSSEEEFVKQSNELTIDADYLEEDSVNALVALLVPTTGVSKPFNVIQILMLPV